RNSCRTTVHSLHGICIHVIRQAAGTSDTRNNGSIMRSHSQFSHRFVQRSQEKMVTTTRTPTRLSLFEIFCCIFVHSLYFLYGYYLFKISVKASTNSLTTNGWPFTSLN